MYSSCFLCVFVKYIAQKVLCAWVSAQSCVEGRGVLKRQYSYLVKPF